MIAVIELLTNGERWVARLLDGSCETPSMSSPETALDALVTDVWAQRVHEIVVEHAAALKDIGASSGCYVDDPDLAEAMAAHPGAGGVPADALWDWEDWDWSGKARG